jgi:hypothetical protein
MQTILGSFHTLADFVAVALPFIIIMLLQFPKHRWIAFFILVSAYPVVTSSAMRTYYSHTSYIAWYVSAALLSAIQEITMLLVSRIEINPPVRLKSNVPPDLCSHH